MRALSMKVMVVFLLFVFSATISAQSAKTKQLIEKAKINFLSSLHSDVYGVVESSIFITMEMKERFPEFDYSNLVDKLNDLAIEGKTPTIRYKAQLASLYFDFPSMFTDVNFLDKENPDKYFKQISDRLEQQPVASN